jgi:hypothetical protein
VGSNPTFGSNIEHEARPEGFDLDRLFGQSPC